MLLFSLAAAAMQRVPAIPCLPSLAQVLLFPNMRYRGCCRLSPLANQSHCIPSLNGKGDTICEVAEFQGQPNAAKVLSLAGFLVQIDLAFAVQLFCKCEKHFILLQHVRLLPPLGLMAGPTDVSFGELHL
jgi:hypothetical protein